MDRQTLADVVKEHNAMQPPSRGRERPAGTQEIVIVEAGRYNDWEGRAKAYEAGERLVTKDWYARVLVEDGFAEWPGEAEALEEAMAAAMLEEVEAALEEIQVYVMLALPAEVVQAMKDRGIETVEDVREASDKKLLSVPGIGPGRLRRIRETLGDPAAG